MNIKIHNIVIQRWWGIVILISLLLILLINISGQAAEEIKSLGNTPWPMYQHDNQHTGQSPFIGITQYPILLWKMKIPDMSGESSSMTMGIDGTYMHKSWED